MHYFFSSIFQLARVISSSGAAGCLYFAKMMATESWWSSLLRSIFPSIIESVCIDLAFFAQFWLENRKLIINAKLSTQVLHNHATLGNLWQELYVNSWRRGKKEKKVIFSFDLSQKNWWPWSGFTQRFQGWAEGCDLQAGWRAEHHCGGEQRFGQQGDPQCVRSDQRVYWSRWVSSFALLCEFWFLCLRALVLNIHDCADRCVVLGAQRDAWGRGYTKATVGTSVLMELAKAFHEMVEKGKKFKCKYHIFRNPRASWMYAYSHVFVNMWNKR